MQKETETERKDGRDISDGNGIFIGLHCGRWRGGAYGRPWYHHAFYWDFAYGRAYPRKRECDFAGDSCRHGPDRLSDKIPNRKLGTGDRRIVYGSICGRLDYGAGGDRKCVSSVLQETRNHERNKLDRDLSGSRKDTRKFVPFLYEVGEGMSVKRNLQRQRDVRKEKTKRKEYSHLR